MFPRRPSVGVLARGRGAVLLLGCLLAVGGCGISTRAPAATPADFQGIATLLAQKGLTFTHIVSGDAGCPDQTLARTAIALDASGLDQPTPTRVYIYIFRNRDAFDRLRQTVDACARSYATNPETFESVEASPYVVAGAGPWGTDFKTALRAVFSQAAGTGD